MGQAGHIAAAEDDGGSSLVFRAGSLLCALRLDEVIETMRPLAVRSLAGSPAYIRGVTIMRGVPTPVVDVARLLGGEQAEITRFLAVRSERGPIAFATGPVLGIQAVTPDSSNTHPALLDGGSSRLVTGVGIIDGRPLLLLQSMRMLPDNIWASAAETS